MKKRKFISISIFIVLISFLVFMGCSNKIEVDQPVNLEDKTEKDETNKEITVNSIEFKTMAIGDLNEDIQSEVEQLKLERGYNYWKSDDGYILFISSGMKSTGGYSIKVNSVEDNEGKTIVSVFETKPLADAMLTQAIEYPYVLIKVNQVVDDFIIKNQNGDNFDKIEADVSKEETIEGVYIGRIDSNSIEVSVGETFMVFRNYNMVKLISELDSGQTVKVTYQLLKNGQYQLNKIESLK